MTVICPKCGRSTSEGSFCERCGADIATVHASRKPPDTQCVDSRTAPQGYGSPVVAAQGRGEQMMPPPPPHLNMAPMPGGRDMSLPGLRDIPMQGVRGVPPRRLRLEIDSLCVLFEDYPGFLRFRFDAGREAENVVISLENPLTGYKAESRRVAFLRGGREITVPVSAQTAGAFVWYVTVSYEADGRKGRLEGEVQMVVVRPREAQKAADQLTVTINNNITNGNASDVHVSQRAVEELAKLATAENPFEELRRLVQRSERIWAAVSLDGEGIMPTLPPQPSAAVCESISLDLPTVRMRFFAGRLVRLGRRRETNDISLRPPDGASDAPYRAMSKAQCCFEHQGDKVVIRDGQFDELRVLKPSSYGTFWNDGRINGVQLLSPGDSGVLSFSGTESEGQVALSVKACRPVRACGTCPHANRTWCGDGRRPALMLTRRDGIAERFVALWSCFPLEEADPSFEGVVIFRKAGGFAWRRGRRCGWLVPGETMNTDFGQVTVS